MNKEKERILIEFKEEVQNVILKTKMKMFDIEEKRIKDTKISFTDRIIGKQYLRDARLNNIYAKRQLTMMEYDNKENNECDINDIISDLYAYSYMDLNNQFTDEMLNVYDNICKDESIKGFINESRVNALTSRKVNDNINIDLNLFSNIRGIGKTGKAITKLEMDTDRINRKTKSLEVKKDNSIFEKILKNK